MICDQGKQALNRQRDSLSWIQTTMTQARFGPRYKTICHKENFNNEVGIFYW